jgi:hypothetical protein
VPVIEQKPLKTHKIMMSGRISAGVGVPWLTLEVEGLEALRLTSEVEVSPEVVVPRLTLEVVMGEVDIVMEALEELTKGLQLCPLYLCPISNKHVP